MAADGHLLLVLNEPPAPDDVHRRKRFFWRAPDGTWSGTTAEPGLDGLAALLGRFTERLDQLDEAVNQAREAADYFEVQRALTPLGRTIRNLHATLQQARESISTERPVITLRDRAHELERRAELLQAEARQGMDYTVARQSEEQNRLSMDMARAAHRLNVMAALFLPLATVTSLFGMNFVSGLEPWNSPRLFWAIAAGALATGLVLGLAIGRTRPRAA